MTDVHRLPNSQEMVITFTAPTGFNYRLEAATNAVLWNALVTLPVSSLSSLLHTDSAAPFLASRAYRALQLPGTTNFTGDHLATTYGDIVFHPIGHASVVMRWNGKTIFNDPTNGALAYQSFGSPDLILVSHDHSDHFSSSTIDAVRGANTILVVPGYIYSNSLSAAQKAISVVLNNGVSTNLLGLSIEAVPAYNANHPLGRGNGYVLGVGGRRVYLSGDTGNTPEMRLLSNIDVAFLCMNIPFTMTPAESTNAVRAFRPRVVYPYHYRDSSGAVTNAAFFKQILGTGPGIEVRLRKWY
ncbi:MAG: hypothetical protein QOF48_2088 [Verrucomicrobiota bacterium]|jgi:L-ascorbate metabolism protein UlaG (beta-lactamase superfamily)